MRIADQLTYGAKEVGMSPAEKNSSPVAAQSSATPIKTNRPDNRARSWERGQNSQFSLKTYRLCGKGREEWHNEKVRTDEWFAAEAPEPVPVVRLTDCDNQLRGIVHMRNSDKGTEVCLSLITPKGAWQTGVWFGIEAADEVTVSWCTDWSGRELTTISLEIQQAVQLGGKGY